MKPLISIIITCYKTEQFLKACIDSILVQTYDNLEIILIDNASPDSCGQICDLYATKDKRIRVAHLQVNQRPAGGRNHGIDMSTGDYIMFVDSDDYIAPNTCEILLSAIIERNADIAMCNFYYVRNNSLTKNEFAIPNQVLTGKEAVILHFKVKPTHLTVPWNKLYKSSLFNSSPSIRFPIDIIEDDEATIYKILYRAAKIILLDTPLYYYVIQQNSTMHSTPLSLLQDEMLLFDNYYNWSQEEAPDMRPLIEWACIHWFNFYVWKCISTNHFKELANSIYNLNRQILQQTENIFSNPYADFRTWKIYLLMKLHLLVPIKYLELFLGKKKI